jgi:hypothetical protein
MNSTLPNQGQNTAERGSLSPSFGLKRSIEEFFNTLEYSQKFAPSWSRWHHERVGKGLAPPRVLRRGKEERKSMRTMVKLTFPTQETNPLIKDGSIGQTMETLLGKLQPEAAYFCPLDGKRGGYLVLNMDNESELVTKIEPFWLELGATVETFPVMNADDLRAGLQSL